MSYLHHSYPYSSHPAVPLDQPLVFDPAMAHSSMIPQPMDGYLYPHPPFEMVDFYPPPIMDYDEYAENLSRPRLTKEQVETLETQFQTHPKPSSNVKRQLAAQTNLSLPRVANWFQNRRAKAKQQKRQEEFERMQKAKAQAEEAARGKSDTADQPESGSTVKAETPDESSNASLAPQKKSAETTSSTASTSRSHVPATSAPRSRHQKTPSESAREATFASLQRALNAAVAARDQFGRSGVEGEAVAPPPPADALEGSMPSSKMYSLDERSQTALNPTFPEWETPAESTSLTWTPSQSPEDTFSYGNLNAATSFTSMVESLSVAEMETPQQSFRRPSDGWSHHHHQHQHHNHHRHHHHMQEHVSKHHHPSASAMEVSFTYPSAASMEFTRRGSSDDLADSLEHIGIDATDSVHLNPQRVDPAAWKEPGKELDLAARRKRPRPAAIGTSASGRSSLAAGTVSMSPTTRLPSSLGATGHSVRQTKSAQSLNSRYAGVRKVSVAQRSPLNFSTFAEAGALSAAKAEMLQPSVSANTLAPPTPLTPEDFQHLLPPASPEGGYCLSAHPASQQLFQTSTTATTQPMQIHIASPPSTPLTMEVLSPFAYTTLAPPLSAPAQYTTFPPEYAGSCEVPLTARSWAEAVPMPSPEMNFAVGMPPSIAQHSISPIPDQGLSMDHETGSYSGSPPGSHAKETEFRIQEFPEQQEAHRFVAAQLSVQPPKKYTFINNATGHVEA
ncbi:hypothetical protein ASPZODRAFT_58774 [Penicilliopsis zonata CBS 506.65]|uniref:Homeobox domain-containing protein n=1 Tax=Penicilliopsis zonata CBS 506.65 TaxID=1073090 RepID=A0A1L9SRD5_9EURO|nr:hypothetical protein ASPZODRAFT_58774 [Penicilliopsis zonata CBS 506.65]OJJ49693.1 hypothetical protein ASPZODRAFT_58774 [Penicilliopsis zonata CBS 506.65]